MILLPKRDTSKITVSQGFHRWWKILSWTHAWKPPVFERMKQAASCFLLTREKNFNVLLTSGEFQQPSWRFGAFSNIGIFIFLYWYFFTYGGLTAGSWRLRCSLALRLVLQTRAQQKTPTSLGSCTIYYSLQRSELFNLILNLQLHCVLSWY